MSVQRVWTSCIATPCRSAALTRCVLPVSPKPCGARTEQLCRRFLRALSTGELVPVIQVSSRAGVYDAGAASSPNLLDEQVQAPTWLGRVRYDPDCWAVRILNHLMTCREPVTGNTKNDPNCLAACEGVRQMAGAVLTPGLLEPDADKF